MSKHTLGGLAGAAALAAVMLIGAAVPASAECRRPIMGERSVGMIQTTTEFSARSKWRAAVRARYGARYARWAKAEEKKMQCSKQEPGRRWACRAVARPCT